MYIDFSSAYNTVNRDVVYRLLKAKGIFEGNEVELLRKLHDKVYFKTQSNEYHFTNGVH